MRRSGGCNHLSNLAGPEPTVVLAGDCIKAERILGYLQDALCNSGSHLKSGLKLVPESLIQRLGREAVIRIR
jgi:hypothetical protein